MKMKRVIARCMLASPLVLLAACGSDDQAAVIENTGTASSLSLNISDGPVDSAVSVVVEFTGISIKSADSEEPVVIEFDEPKSIDLLSLQGTAYENLLSELSLEAGEYEWVRLFVNAEIDGVMDSYIESDDGTMKELFIPSGSESGLKIKTKIVLEEGEEAQYTIDFDLRRSLHVYGEEGTGLKPSLRMVDNRQSSSIDGLVSDTLISESCEDGQVGAIYAYEGKDVVPTDHSLEEGGPVASALVHETDEGYQYELGYLKSGEYTLAYTCDEALDTPEAVEGLSFLSTVSIDLEARKSRHLDMVGDGEEGRNKEHADGEEYRGFNKESWGRNRGYMNADFGLTEEDKVERDEAFQERIAEFEAREAEWDSLSEEEKAAKQTEWEDKKQDFEDAGRGMTQEEREAKQAEWDALTEEEKAAKQAEWEYKKEGFENDGRGMTQEDRDAKKAEWDALTEEEKAAKQAEWEAAHDLDEGEGEVDDESESDDSPESEEVA